MSTAPNVALRFSELDKAALVELASRLQLNQTQTVRVLVRETLTVLKEREVITTADKFNHALLVKDSPREAQSMNSKAINQSERNRRR